MSTSNSPETLIVVSCGKKKINPQSGAAPIRANHAYISTYFKICAEYAEKFSDRWMILSGKFGLIDPGAEIDPRYDYKLRRAGVFDDLLFSQFRSLLGDSPLCVISLCGKKYSHVLGKALRRFGLALSTPLDGLKMGERQKALKTCIENSVPLE